MIAIYRWILRLTKKEHVLVTNYQRSHPHFLLYIGLDAVLSFALVFVGIQIANSHSSVSHKLVEAGAATISAEQLSNLVKNEHIDAFWLGPMPEDEYTINHEISGIADVFYLPKVSDQSSGNLYVYEVKTYENKGIWDAHTHSLLSSANTSTIRINKDLSIKINRASMKGEIATLANKSEIVAIAYPTAQTLDTMIKNAERITSIQ
ncbi:MAG TPA: hypothetical protein VF307_08005 [Candidatus Nanopelagicaceae bacterium]